MHCSSLIGNLGSNHSWRYFWFLHWQKFPLQPPATLLIFFLLVCKLCKSGLQIIHYILKMSRYTIIAYIGRYLVLTYIERFISTVCYFFSYICWSVNCMSWVSKFNNFFLTWTETEPRFIFEGFNIVLYGRSFLTLQYLFCFFVWSVNCSASASFSLFFSQEIV